MQNTISFISSNSSINTFKTDLFFSGLFENKKINKTLDSKVSKAIAIESFKGKYKKKILVYADDLKRIIVLGLGKESKFSNLRAREVGAMIANYANQLGVSHISLDVKSLRLGNNKLAQSLFEGIILGNYEFLVYKTMDSKPHSLKKVTVLGKYDKNNQNLAMNIANSVNYARDLGNHPSNILTPTYLANEAKKIAKHSKMSSKIIDVQDFTKLGLGSFYGVARGAKEPAKLIIVEYSGGTKNQKPLALVGKGVTFDTGGISIKPSPAMDEMKFDMCGAATVMGVMNAVSILQPKINLIFAIGATENMPGGNAQRPGDIVTAYNGKTIEVLNTDAEGRLILADVLAYVEKKYKPESMIDFATLTGAVLIALGDTASGIMGNDEELIKEIKKSSNNTDEKVWQLPLWEEYSKDIKSKVADVKNLGRSRLAGTIAGGVFLQEFVNNTPWVHMDIAGTAWGPKEPNYLPKHGATGVAVRLIYDLITNRVK